MKSNFGSWVLVGALGLVACDASEAEPKQADAEVAVQASYTLASEELDLATVTALIEREDVRDAASLEALINAEESSVVIDIDDDGKRDFVQVHEVAVAGRVDVPAVVGEAEVEAVAEVEGGVVVDADDGERVRFELRAVPSSKVVEVEASEAVLASEVEVETVVVASLDFQLDVEASAVVVEASYAPIVVVSESVEATYVHRISLTHHHDHLVVVGAPFLAWMWIDVRPVYVGHVHLPPGQAKKLGLHWHGHGHGHGHGNVHVKVHDGPDKVHVKVHDKGHGSEKVHVKVHDKGHGPNEVHVESNGGGTKVHVKGGGKGSGGGKSKGGGKGKL